MSTRTLSILALTALVACDKESAPIGDDTSEPQPEAIDADDDGFAVGEDCNDADARVFPDAPERCNGIDDDCDDSIDEDLFGTFYRDADGDGFGTDAITSDACVLPGGFVEVAGDCDDSDAEINPDALEKCDLIEVDDDCDGLVNAEDDGVVGALLWFTDVDGDGYGDPATAVESCSQVPGLVSQGTDCNDGDPDISPRADEVCDPKDVDEDCDTFSDESDPEGPLGIPLRYFDGDGDGYGDQDSPGQYFCDSFGPEWVTKPGDCDDDDIDVRPFRYEDCTDGKDNDCNGEPDDCGPVDPVNLNDADAWFQGTGSYTYFSMSVDRAGDVDGDGDDDVIVGAQYDGSYVGKAYVFDGMESGLATDVYESSFTGKTTYSYYGTGVSEAGDVDGDGYDDLVISPYSYGAATTVFFGPVSGDYDSDDADVSLLPDGTSSGAGYSIDGGQDVDGDGFDDVLVGAHYRGSTSTSYDYRGGVYVVTSGHTGSSSDLEDAPLILVGQATYDYLGQAVSFAGDVNGDGLADVIGGAPNADPSGYSSGGRAYLVYGGTTGAVLVSDADLIIEGNASSAYLGMSVGGGSDQNADGYDDVIVGAPYYSSYRGAAAVFEGPFTHGSVRTLTTADGMLLSDKTSAYLGFAVRGDGDVNGDGWGDWLAGAYYYSDTTISGGASYAGAAFLMRGPVEGTVYPADIRARMSGAQSYSYTGRTVSFAGDQDGDGREDVLVGAYGWYGPKGGYSMVGGAFVVLGDRL